MSHRYVWLLVILLCVSILAAYQRVVGFSYASITMANHGNYSETKVVRHPQNLVLRSASALVKDQETGEFLVQKQANTILPIASITKLMTAMIVLDAQENLQESLTIVDEDVDNFRHSQSRLPVNTSIPRGSALLLALMASENRAAHALGRTYPGGLGTFVAAMNTKALSLGLLDTHFEDPTGISSGNTSTARDLARLVDAAYHYQLIRESTTCKEATINLGHRTRQFRNTNQLIRNPKWQIGLSKTGFIDEAGRCLVMQLQVAKRPVLIVLLDAQGKFTRYGDANRIKQWMEGSQVVQQKNKS